MTPRLILYQLARTQLQQVIPKSQASGFGCRYFHPTMDARASLKPAARVAAQRQDVWYVAVLVTPWIPIPAHILPSLPNQQYYIQGGQLKPPPKTGGECLLSSAAYLHLLRTSISDLNMQDNC
jgi:hypothetical protein